MWRGFHLLTLRCKVLSIETFRISKTRKRITKRNIKHWEYRNIANCTSFEFKKRCSNTSCILNNVLFTAQLTEENASRLMACHTVYEKCESRELIASLVWQSLGQSCKICPDQRSRWYGSFVKPFYGWQICPWCTW